jgi:hypothetical protein
MGNRPKQWATKHRQLLLPRRSILVLLLLLLRLGLIPPAVRLGRIIIPHGKEEEEEEEEVRVMTPLLIGRDGSASSAAHHQ